VSRFAAGAPPRGGRRCASRRNRGAALPAIAQPLTPRVPPRLADAAVRAVEAVAH